MCNITTLKKSIVRKKKFFIFFTIKNNNKKYILNRFFENRYTQKSSFFFSHIHFGRRYQDITLIEFVWRHYQTKKFVQNVIYKLLVRFGFMDAYVGVVAQLEFANHV